VPSYSLRNWHHNVQYQVSSVVGRDDSWPATVPSVVPSLWYSTSIANLMADSELGSPDSYSSILITIRLSRLVSVISACDRQTDGWTVWTITIAGPHIVVGQLIIPKTAN